MTQNLSTDMSKRDEPTTDQLPRGADEYTVTETEVTMIPATNLERIALEALIAAGRTYCMVIYGMTGSFLKRDVNTTPSETALMKVLRKAYDVVQSLELTTDERDLILRELVAAYLFYNQAANQNPDDSDLDCEINPLVKDTMMGRKWTQLLMLAIPFSQGKESVEAKHTFKGDGLEPTSIIYGVLKALGQDRFMNLIEDLSLQNVVQQSFLVEGAKGTSTEHYEFTVTVADLVTRATKLLVEREVISKQQ